jgi:hypothetical protein
MSGAAWATRGAVLLRGQLCLCITFAFNLVDLRPGCRRFLLRLLDVLQPALLVRLLNVCRAALGCMLGQLRGVGAVLTASPIGGAGLRFCSLVLQIRHALGRREQIQLLLQGCTLGQCLVGPALAAPHLGQKIQMLLDLADAPLGKSPRLHVCAFSRLG